MNDLLDDGSHWEVRPAMGPQGRRIAKRNTVVGVHGVVRPARKTVAELVALPYEAREEAQGSQLILTDDAAAVEPHGLLGVSACKVDGGADRGCAPLPLDDGEDVEGA